MTREKIMSGFRKAATTVVLTFAAVALGGCYGPNTTGSVSVGVYGPGVYGPGIYGPGPWSGYPYPGMYPGAPFGAGGWVGVTICCEEEQQQDQQEEQGALPRPLEDEDPPAADGLPVTKGADPRRAQ